MKVHELFGRNIGLEPKMNHLDFKLNSTCHTGGYKGKQASKA